MIYNLSRSYAQQFRNIHDRFVIKCNKHSEERTNEWRGERDKNCVNWIRSGNATQTKTTNACPTLGYPAYKHLIRIYAANTCINYVKNEFITTPAHSPITQRLNILFHFFYLLRRLFHFGLILIINCCEPVFIRIFICISFWFWHAIFITIHSILRGGARARYVCVDKKNKVCGVVAWSRHHHQHM